LPLAFELSFDKAVDDGSRSAPERKRRWLVNSEVFRGRLLEGLREPCRGVASVAFDEVALAHALAAGEVEPGRLAGAREGDVPPLPQPLLLGAEYEGTLDGQPLAGMASE